MSPNPEKTLDKTRNDAAQPAPEAALGTVSPQPPAAARRVPRLLLVMTGAVLAAAVALGGWLLLNAGVERTEDARVIADIIPLSARATGQVVKVFVIEDQPVKQGDVLLELDDRVAIVREAQAEAELVVARAQLRAATAEVQVVKAQAKGGLRSAQAGVTSSQEEGRRVEARIASAEANVLLAEKEMQQATTELERVQKLFAASMVSQSHLDDARVAQERANTQLARAQAERMAARSEKLLSESRVVEAFGRLDQSSAPEALIARAEAAVELATGRVTAAEQALAMERLQRSFLKIVAPRDGTASKLMAHEGQFVQTGQLLVQLVSSTPLIVANFKETQICCIQPGQRATVHIDAYPDQPLSGKVVSIAGGTGASFALLPPNNASGNFVKVVQRVPVRIALTEPSPVPLQAGLSVEVSVHTR